MKKRVLIFGGGIAGLTAAVHLVRTGFEVTLLEKHPYAGGRTYSFRKPFWPFPIDNGPHVMLGAYSALLELLRLTGGARFLGGEKGLRVPYRGAAGKRAELRAAGLPPPLHLAVGLWRFPLLDRRAKWAILRAFLQVRRLPDSPGLDAKSAGDWLCETGQTGPAREMFWRPLVLATLNAEPEQVSFLQLLRVLKLGFLAGKSESRILTLPEGLTPTLISPALDWLEKRGAAIRYREGVRRLHFRDGHVAAVETARESYRDFAAVVSAVPPHVLADILRNSGERAEETARRLQFAVQPILNLHFWWREPLLAEPFAALLGGRGQWLFRGKSVSGLTHYTVVVSGAAALLEERREVLVQQLLAELEKIFPGFEGKGVLHRYLVVEKRATVLCSPGTEERRPPPGRLLGNLFVAGDWTRTGLPPTMESAARSGTAVAEEIASLHPH